MKYKIFKYVDGFGKEYFRPKRCIFGLFYFNIKVYDSEHSYYFLEFPTRNSARNWIEDRVETEKREKLSSLRKRA